MVEEQKKSTKQLETLIYYGSESKQANFRVVPGQYYAHQDDQLYSEISQEAINQSLKFRDFQNQSRLLIPCLPCCEIQAKFKIKELPQGKQSYESEAPLIETILIKTDNQQDAAIQGYQSGKRSAIIQKNGKFYRLKGCGMMFDGFTLDKFDSFSVKDAFMIKGCHFEHTAKRELYNANKIDNILRKHGILGANRSEGYWAYSPTFNQITNQKNDVPEVQKLCCVYETVGERRAITHLIQGVNMILISIAQLLDNEDNQAFVKLFPLNRQQSNGTQVDQTPLAYTTDLAEGQTLSEKLKQPVFKPEHEEGLQNFLNLKELPLKNIEVKTILEKCLENFQVNAIYNDLLKETTERLQTLSFNDLMHIISLVYGRIGFEIGRIIRIFANNEINWGYYLDHDDEPHFNFHPNNLVVIPESLQNDNLLAPLDFDMCFGRSEFVNIIKGDPKYGQLDPAQFDLFQEQPRNLLEYCLIGMELVGNFKFQSFDFKKFDESTNQRYNNLLNGLKDTLIFQYMQGYELKQMKGAQVSDIKGNKFFHDFIRLSLIFTTDFTC